MRTLTRVVAKNFLSLKDVDISLGDLNVLVGPNGSGKTNFLNLIRFIGEVARDDLTPALESFGGFQNLVFRDKSFSPVSFSWNLPLPPPFHAEITVHGPMTEAEPIDIYSLVFWNSYLIEESPDDHILKIGNVIRKEAILLHRENYDCRISILGRRAEFERNYKNSHKHDNQLYSLEVQETSSGLPLLRRLGEAYEGPRIEMIAQIFERSRFFEINVSAARQPASMRESQHLLSDASNLAAFLVYMRKAYPERFELLKEDVAFVLPAFRDFKFYDIGGAGEAVRVDIIEAPLTGATPLAYTSFGTIRAIALFAMLHDPNPPRLTCLEEIDHGLHPHALDRLVERLRDASKETQIIVATHSPALVNRLEPEELIIFQRDPETGATVQREISPKQIRAMEQESGYRLGELWFSGALGGIP